MKENYYTKFVNFFKKHGLYNEEIFKYINKNTERFNYYSEEITNIRGLYHYYNKYNELISFKLYLPHIEDNITAIINIRPYIQAIYAYPNLGKKHSSNIDVEIIAIYFEKLYLKENPDPELENYLNNIYTSIKKENNNNEYQIALNAQEKLKNYQQRKKTNLKKLQRKAKKLSKKY